MEVYYIVNAINQGPKAGALDIDKRKAGLTAIIARLYSLKGMGNSAVVKGPDGRDYPSPDVQLAVNELEKEIAFKYPFLTMSEIRLALESGVKGELDDQPTYLNVANYCRWLRLYRNGSDRLEALQAIENGKRLAAPAYQLDAGTVETRNEEAGARKYEELLAEVRETGAIGPAHSDMVCAMVYNYLRKTGRMEKPVQSTIDAAIDVALKFGCAKPKVNDRAKRVLLQFYLQKIA